MRRKNVSILAVIAFLAVAASSAWAEPSGVNCRWGGDEPTQVVVDGEYAKEHPEQVGIQGVVVDTRNRVAVLETDVRNLQNSPADNTPAETPATSNLNGPRTTINYNVFPSQPYTPGAVAPPAGSYPPPPPYGGPATTSAPPAQGDSTVNTSAISPWGGLGMFLIIVVVGVVAAIIFMYIIPAIRRRRMEDAAEIDELNVANNGRAIANNARQRVAQGFTPVPAYNAGQELEINTDAQGNFTGYSERKWTSADAQASSAAQAVAGPGSLPGLAPSAGPGNPEIVAAGISLTRTTTVALATTATPPVSYPVGTVFPQASATSPAGTQDNLDALAAALVGLPALTQPVVDPIRDALAIAGTIKL